jgi:hypothetical protein
MIAGQRFRIGQERQTNTAFEFMLQHFERVCEIGPSNLGILGTRIHADIGRTVCAELDRVAPQQKATVFPRF